MVIWYKQGLSLLYSSYQYCSVWSMIMVHKGLTVAVIGSAGFHLLPLLMVHPQKQNKQNPTLRCIYHTVSEVHCVSLSLQLQMLHQLPWSAVMSHQCVQISVLSFSGLNPSVFIVQHPLMISVCTSFLTYRSFTNTSLAVNELVVNP